MSDKYRITPGMAKADSDKAVADYQAGRLGTVAFVIALVSLVLAAFALRDRLART